MALLPLFLIGFLAIGLIWWEGRKERDKTDTHIHLVLEEDWAWPPKGKTRVGIDKEAA